MALVRKNINNSHDHDASGVWIVHCIGYVKLTARTKWQLGEFSKYSGAVQIIILCLVRFFVFHFEICISHLISCHEIPIRDIREVADNILKTYHHAWYHVTDCLASSPNPLHYIMHFDKSQELYPLTFHNVSDDNLTLPGISGMMYMSWDMIVQPDKAKVWIWRLDKVSSKTGVKLLNIK